MLQVLRIEGEDGQGPFCTTINEDLYDILPNLCDRHFSVDSWSCDTSKDGTKIPPPRKDGLDIYLDDKEWFCAFNSLEQFNKLFRPEEVKVLINAGYSIYLLKVFQYQKSVNQVLFTKESIIKTECINSLFE